MAVDSRGVVEKDILQKLSHPIANVRNRALQSVVFKISNQLVEPSDLAGSRIFIKSLLEWFNNDQWECETLVIQLLEIMSNFEPAAINLVDIGAVDFLSELRPHLDSGMHIAIDNILENLMKLHASLCVNHSPVADSEHSSQSLQIPVDTNIVPSPNPNRILNSTNPLCFVVTDCAGHENDFVSEEVKSKKHIHWIALSRADLHILSSTVFRLKSSNLEETYSFVSNILFADFPPSVFLQRPKLIQIIVDHLRFEEPRHQSNVISLALDALITFIAKLREAVTRSCDLLTCDMKDSSVLVNSTSAESDLESLPPETFSLVVSKSLNVMDFVELVLSTLTTMLLTCIDKQLPWLDTNVSGCGHVLASSVVLLISNGIKLILSLADLTVLVSREYHIRKEGLEDKTSLAIHHISIALSHCTSKMRRARESGVIPHTLLMLLSPLMAALGTSLSILVSNCITIDESLSCLSPASFAGLKEIFTDSVLSIMCRHYSNHLVPVLRSMDKGTIKLYFREQDMIESFQHIHCYQSSSDLTVLCCNMKKCLSGFYFSFGDREETLVKNVVKRIIEFMCGEDVESEKLSRCQSIVLQLISHGNDNVKDFTCFELKDHLSTLPAVNEYSVLLRLYTEQLINQLCYHSVTQHVFVVTWWLHHFHLYNRCDFEDVKNILPLILPYIESCAIFDYGISEILFKLLMCFFHNILPRSECLHSLCRLMMSKSQDVRSKSSTHLIEYLSKECGSHISHHMSIPFHNILLNIPVSKLPAQFLRSKSSSTVKEKDVLQLFTVLRSSTVDVTLTQLTLEQFAILLRDTSLHQCIIEGGLLSIVIDLLHSTDTTQSKDIVVPLLQPAVSCLLLMTLAGHDVRNTLRGNNTLIQDLLKYVIVFCDVSSSTFSVEIKLLLSLIMFGKVIDFSKLLNDVTDSTVNVPQPLLDGFHLPFKANAVTPCSTNAPLSPIDSSFLSSVPIRRRLLLQYEMSVLGGFDNLSFHSLSDQLYFNESVTEKESNSVLFDLHSLMHIRPDLWTSNARLLECACDQYLMARAVFTMLLRSPDYDRIDFVFGVKEQFSKIFSCDNNDLSVCCNEMRVLCVCVDCCSEPDIQWLWQSFTDTSSGLWSVLDLLLSCSTHTNEHRNFIDSFLDVLSKLLMNSTITDCPLFLVMKLQVLLERIVQQESYDMSLLQKGLHVMVYATAKLSFGKSNQLLKVCFSIMNILRKIVCLLLSGRGSMLSSFMGKKATRNATVSLSQVIAVPIGNDWMGSWLSADADSLTWLLALLYDRDPEICYYGYSILSTLCSQRSSCTIVMSSMPNIHSHGLLGLCLDVGLNVCRCDLIRHQAFSVVVNLLVTCSSHNIDVLLDDQKNVVTSEHVLSNGGFFQSFTHLLKSYISTIESHHITHDGELDHQLRQLTELHQLCHPQVLSMMCRTLQSITVTDYDDTQELMCRIISNTPIKIVLMLSIKTLSRPLIAGIWMQLYCDILSLLQHCVKVDEESDCLIEACTKAFPLISYKDLLPATDEDNTTLYYDLCYSVILLLRTVYVRHLKSRDLIVSMILSNWKEFIGLIQNTYHREQLKLPLPSELLKECVLLLSTLLYHCCGNAKASNELDELLKRRSSLPLLSNDKSSMADNLPFSMGAHLCHLLILIMDSCRLEHVTFKDLIMKSLSFLVCNSEEAKEAVIVVGFLESSIEDIKFLHAKVIRNEKQSLSKPMLDQLIGVVGFFQNLMFQSMKLKFTLVKSQFVPVLLDVWPICTVNGSLLKAVVKMLIVYTAHCSEAQISLTSHAKPNGNLYHSILKMTSNLMTRHKSFVSSNRPSPHCEGLALMFKLLANTVVCLECRAVLKKTNFLPELLSFHSKVSTSVTNHSSAMSSIVALWMNVLVNLSASNDGQKMLSQLPGVIDVVCDSNRRNDLLCLQIVRSLCCYSPIKSLIASNEKVIDILETSLKSDNHRVISVAALAVWSLLYNSVRLRSHLRQTNIVQLLSNIKANLRTDNNQELIIYVDGALSLLTVKL